MKIQTDEYGDSIENDCCYIVQLRAQSTLEMV